MLDDRLENGVNIYLMSHFAVAVVWHIVEIDIRLEIVVYSDSTVLPFLILFSGRITVLYAISTKRCSWATNDS